ncbi:MAG TPA: hypothetical protein VJR89_33530 [Polyangiales bacterium]|nr:hypothetical protein [Polyangiales bacterium]
MTRVWLVLCMFVLPQPAAAQIWGPAPEAEPVPPEYEPQPEEAQPEGEVEPDADAPVELEPEQPELRVRVSIGAGVGRLSFDWPAEGQTRSVQTGAFAAIDLGIGFAVATSPLFSIGTQLEYQSSIGSEVEETHSGGATDTLRIRAGRFAGLLVTEFRVGILRVAPGVGYSTRSLRPEVHHLLTPSYNLQGPLGRIALRFALGDQFAIRIAPELQYLFVSDSLQELGMQGGGLSFGAELAFELRISETLGLEAAARDAHASLPAIVDQTSNEVGQFAVLRLVWEP